VNQFLNQHIQDCEEEIKFLGDIIPLENLENIVKKIKSEPDKQ